jgi:hypothetical protein
MDTIVSYLEDTEKKLMKEVTELFNKMRDQGNNMSLEGIKDMYSYTPVEGVLYEPCLRIPISLGPRNGYYYWNDFALPKDEYVIYKHETTYQRQNGQSWDAPTYKCIALTSHGRCFVTKQVTEIRNFPTHDFMQYNGTYSPDANIPIIKLNPLPYKIPTSIFRALKIGMGISGIHIGSLHCHNTRDGVNEGVIQTLSDTTASLQELNKEFYLFAGKWQPHMTRYVTLDVDQMRETIIENTHSIKELNEKCETLEEQNKKLLVELNELKEQTSNLEKEKVKLLPLEKYKEVVVEFMNFRNIHHDGTDLNIIEQFRYFHTNKVFMDERIYDDVMNSKEELNEYRIYKKVKGEMVSNGMDNSRVARNVQSIKKSVLSSTMKYQS